VRPRVNLLPQSYLRGLKRRRHVRLGVAVGAALLGAELFGGFALHTRAGKTRELLDEARTTQAATDLVKAKMEAPTRESEQLTRQLGVARKIRATHRWSRLLGALAKASSPRVTLTAISTDPPKWAASLDPDARTSAEAAAGSGAPSLLAGVTVRGYAADYEELSKFAKGVQAANIFASVSLLDARRDRYLEHDVLSFELRCRW
jgi:hypothetical protein